MTIKHSVVKEELEQKKASQFITALILCGGRGERLRPLTNDRPKSLIEVNNKSIIARQMEWLLEVGIKNVKFLTGAMSDKIRAAYPSYKAYDCNTGTLDAINKPLSEIPDDNDVIVLNGDILTDMSINDFIKKAQNQDADMTLFLTYGQYRFGVVGVDGDDIVEFKEKPYLPYWVNGGVYYIKPKARRYLQQFKGDIEQAFHKLVDKIKIKAYKDNKCKWIAIDSIKDVKKAEELFK